MHLVFPLRLAPSGNSQCYNVEEHKDGKSNQKLSAVNTRDLFREKTYLALMQEELALTLPRQMELQKQTKKNKKG